MHLALPDESCSLAPHLAKPFRQNREGSGGGAKKLLPTWISISTLALLQCSPRNYVIDELSRTCFQSPLVVTTTDERLGKKINVEGDRTTKLEQPQLPRNYFSTTDSAKNARSRPSKGILLNLHHLRDPRFQNPNQPSHYQHYPWNPHICYLAIHVSHSRDGSKPLPTLLLTLPPRLPKSFLAQQSTTAASQPNPLTIGNQSILQSINPLLSSPLPIAETSSDKLTRNETSSRRGSSRETIVLHRLAASRASMQR